MRDDTGNRLADELHERLNELYRTRLDEFALELWQLTVAFQTRPRTG